MFLRNMMHDIQCGSVAKTPRMVNSSIMYSFQIVCHFENND